MVTLQQLPYQDIQIYGLKKLRTINLFRSATLTSLPAFNPPSHPTHAGGRFERGMAAGKSTHEPVVCMRIQRRKK